LFLPLTVVQSQTGDDAGEDDKVAKDVP